MCCGQRDKEGTQFFCLSRVSTALLLFFTIIFCSKYLLLYDDLEEAIAFVLKEVQPGDVILLAGCQGMDSGGKLLLEKLADGKSEKEREEIMDSVKNRICGI